MTKNPQELRAAAAALVNAAEMLEHNDAIFKGKWKKGSKSWSGDFIERTIADAAMQAGLYLNADEVAYLRQMVMRDYDHERAENERLRRVLNEIAMSPLASECAKGRAAVALQEGPHEDSGRMDDRPRALLREVFADSGCRIANHDGSRVVTPDWVQRVSDFLCERG